MLSRIFSRLLILASLAVLAGITFYFMDTYRTLRRRERVVLKVTEVADRDGPCAGLATLRDSGTPEAEVAHALQGLRSRLVARVVGDDDLRGRRVLTAADREGLVDRALCEQIRLSHEVGEVHPVLALLRYTREGGSPCEEEPRLAAVLDGLDSHRPVMLRALMRDLHELSCLSPALSEKVAAMVADATSDSPKLMDGLDVLRISAFLSEWAPLEAAQLGCRVEGKGEASELGAALGCTADARARVLVHYRTVADLPASGDQPALAAGAEVVLVHEDEPFCEVIPAAGGALRTLACRALRLSSDLVLAARIEAISYGRAEADLLAGLATYQGDKAALVPAVHEPELKSWFGYDRDGELVGGAHRIELAAVAAMLGEAVPDEPLRAFCKKSGAKYCYDVDWAHVVSRLRGEPVLYLSRPAEVFLAPEVMSSDDMAARLREAFGREPIAGATTRLYALNGGGELAVETTREDVAVRWRLGAQGPWKAQAFGRGEGGARPPSARLLAALDLERDGRPELVVQRVEPQGDAGAKDRREELLLLRLPPGRDTFTVLNELTVHEY